MFPSYSDASISLNQMVLSFYRVIMNCVPGLGFHNLMEGGTLFFFCDEFFTKTPRWLSTAVKCSIKPSPVAFEGKPRCEYGGWSGRWWTSGERRMNREIIDAALRGHRRGSSTAFPSNAVESKGIRERYKKRSRWKIKKNGSKKKKGNEIEE